MLLDLISWAMLHQASDIHLAAGKSIWLRCQGIMREFSDKQVVIKDLLMLLTEEQQEKLKAQHFIDMAYTLDSSQRLRINLFQQHAGLSAVIRIISPNIPHLSDLPAPPTIIELLQAPQGLILVTGPTGSGKSTTLAAMVAEINRQQCKHIITLEDPIEFLHASKKSLVTQRECGEHFTDYPSALKSVLREDPDVILIGELRDLDSIRLALTAAETGHLVLATLHTRTAASTVNRIIDVFPGENQSLIRLLLAETLLAIVSQRLITKTSRQADFEILRTTPAVRQLIRDQNTSQLISAMQMGGAYGMKLFSADREYY